MKTPTDVIELSNKLMEKRESLLSLWQVLAEHFYPERADFTNTRNIGAELSDQLVDSYPILVRRDLANSFGAMLRDGDTWFKMGVEGNSDHMGNMWLQWATTRLFKMFKRVDSGFARATAQGDHDYATFGQCVISIERNRKADGLLIRNWHLRDCAWSDGVNGRVEVVTRKDPGFTFRDAVQFFGEDKVHSTVKNDQHKTPYKSLDLRHIVMPSEMYGDEKLSRFPFVSIYVDVIHQHILEAVGQTSAHYIVPRFQTISGTPYAYSPATVAGLPDARTLQAMTFTLLEAGERYARPPIIATQEAIRGDVNLMPDGVTWVSEKYDEKLGASLRTLPQDRGGFPIGLEMRSEIKGVLGSAFYLDKISLPEVSHEMTAYEVAERMKQFRREALPLFSPIEADYNGQLCETAFEIAMNSGFLGSPHDIPDSLRDRDIEFKFESPLTASEEEKKATQFNQTAELLAQAAQFDQGIGANVNFDVAIRDAVMGVGSPATWLYPLEQVMQTRQQQQMQEAIAQAAELQGVG